ncbi:class I SAM-dependent methyltransferase [Oerskovia merdavium]|uniref:Class I SAM-dependent methyltransferase n=1 Tax=Oerskovia merdavium TaxID=2762227 RepID=A0ABR8TU59_9CELL|nr:class I SAM-dependent methyltransferase [Oerskovia merdavium]MBD7979280.1 class I SAM-dependent methyltransferase [Oerskovia merdavium]
MPSKYAFDFDPQETNTSHGLLVGMVPPRSRVLDVGCAAGYLGDALKDKECIVRGVELDPVAAEEARAHLASVVVADAETLDYAAEFGAEAFDVVVLADVLEHVRNPARILAGALSVLTEDGTLVISIPNVAHGSLRLGLLQGRWNYTPLGLLDETHVRFVTWDTLQDLLTDAGIVVTAAWMTTADPLATEVDVDPALLPQEIVDWVRAQPLALGYQFVLSARRAVPGETAPQVEPLPAGPVVTPAESPTIVSAREEADRLRRTLADREDELRAAKEIIAYHEAAALEAEQRLRDSAAWRVGNAVVTPLRAAKRAFRPTDPGKG